MIMATVIFKIGNIIPFDFALSELKKSLEIILTNKGKDVINRNLNAIDETINNIKEESISLNESIADNNMSDNIFDIIVRIFRSEVDSW